MSEHSGGMVRGQTIYNLKIQFGLTSPLKDNTQFALQTQA